MSYEKELAKASSDKYVIQASLRLDYIMEKVINKLGGKYELTYDQAIKCWLVYYNFNFNGKSHTTMLSFDYYACMGRHLYDDILQKLYTCMCPIFLDGTYTES